MAKLDSGKKLMHNVGEILYNTKKRTEMLFHGALMTLLGSRINYKLMMNVCVFVCVCRNTFFWHNNGRRMVFQREKWNKVKTKQKKSF